MRSNTRWLQCITLLSLFFLYLRPSIAQTQRGDILGRVTDTSGAAVPGAKIQVRNRVTGVTLSTESNAAGLYTVSVQYGVYDMTISKTGFSPTTVAGIHIFAATTTSEDVVLKVGSVSTSVVVRAKAGTLQTSSSVVGTSVGTTLMQNAPNLVQGGQRSPFSYVYMMPAVYPQGQLTVAGGRTLSTEILLNGQTADLGGGVMGGGGGGLPSVEAIGEFKMLSNSMPSEYGRSSGGEVTFATKSGTDLFHGSADWYFHNYSLDARPWQAVTRNPEKQNEFDVALGGPVVIPKIYDGKHKTFFWATVTDYRLRTAAATGVLSLPTQAMRNGDFTASDINPIYDPLDLVVGPGGKTERSQFDYGGTLNRIDPNRFSQVSKFFLAKLPLPNRPGDFNNFVGSASNVTNNWDGTVKIDHTIGNNDRVSGFFQWGYPNATSGSFLGSIFGSETIGHFYRPQLDWVHNFGSNLINDLSLGMTLNESSTQSANYGQDFGRKAGLQGTLDPNCPQIWIDYPSGFSICGSNPANTSATTVKTLNDSITWVKGFHIIKSGIQLIRWDEDSNTRGGTFINSSAGGYQFDDGGTQSVSGTGGNVWASFLLGYPTVVNMASPLVLGERETYLALFTQDDWKIKPKLTLNAGLRWDLNIPYTEVHGQIAAVDLARPNPGAGNLPGAMTYYGFGPGRNGITRPGLTHWRDFGPRLGLAYAFNNKTAFRAFGGIVYQGIQDANASFANRTGFQASGSPEPNVNPYGLYYSWNTLYPQNVLGTVPFTDPSFRNGQAVTMQNAEGIGRAPALYMYSAALEREIPGNIMLTASYLANKMRWANDHMPLGQLNPRYWSLGQLLLDPLNSPQVQALGFKAPFPEFNTNLPLYRALDPYPQYLSVQDDASDSTSGDYDAGIFQAQKQFSSGLAFLFSYTISKNITDTTWAPGAFGASPRDAYDRHLEKVIQRFDTPQMLVLSYSYQLPFGPGRQLLNSKNRVANAVLGGWVVAGIQRYQSGTPVAISGSQSLGIPTIGVMADRAPGVPLRSKISCGQMVFGNPQEDYLLNAGNAAQAAATGRPLAYLPEGDFQLGNAPAIDASARQCGNADEDISLMKNFRVGERLNFQFGVDAFNIFNRHTWQIVQFGTNNINNPHFGEITPFQINGPRQVQLHLRIEF